MTGRGGGVCQGFYEGLNCHQVASFTLTGINNKLFSIKSLVYNTNDKETGGTGILPHVCCGCLATYIEEYELAERVCNERRPGEVIIESASYDEHAPTPGVQFGYIGL